MLNAKRKRAFTDLGDQRGFLSFDPGGCTSGLINTTRMNAKTCGAVPMVRIHLPPARSLQTLGPQLLPKAVVESGAMVPIEIAPDNGRPRWPDRDGIIEIAFGCGARVRLRGEVSSQALRQVMERHRQLGICRLTESAMGWAIPGDTR